MKKFALFLICSLFASGMAVAQKGVVDAAEKEIKGFTPNFVNARNNLKPALTNPETKDDARTWFIAGKTEFGYYDQLLGKKQLKQPVNDIEMGNALLDGYNYFMTALPLDSVKEKDKNGNVKLEKDGRPKVKTKYSKDIIGLIAGHFNDFTNVASSFYDAKEYNKAYDAWEIFTTLPKNNMLGKLTPEVADTIIGQIQFFQGIAAWQGGDLKKAVNAFAKARKSGYVKKEAFDYALSFYAGLGDNDGIIAVAKEAFPIFGSEDPQYISIMINDMINNQKFDEATALLDKAIEANPNNAEFYDVKGTLYENKGDMDSAIKFFKQAIEINPEYSKAQFNVGRYYYNLAVKKNEALDKNLSAQAFQKVFENELKPLYLQALPHIEKAYKLDSENSEIKHALRNLYYLLGDEQKLNEIEKGY